MAVWQFTVVLIPKSWAVENEYNSLSLYGEDGYATDLTWKFIQPSMNLEGILSEILPPGKSWHDDMKHWGKSAENDIKVWYDEKRISEISIRLDLRQSPNPVVQKVIFAAQQLGCSLFLPEHRDIIDPELDNFKLSIEKSRAWRCLNDPERFFDEINK